MTTPAGAKMPLPSDVADRPWYELISDVAEPIEDGMQQEDTIDHVNPIIRARYADDPTVLVSGPTAVIVYDSDTPGSVISPDCYVVFGVDTEFIRRERRSYRIDEWGKPPAFVMEVASASTAARDLGDKREIYARIGVTEYWRLDRNGEHYGEPLVGERLVDGEYERLELREETDGSTWSRSEVLGVDVYHLLEDGFGRFRLRDSATGEWLNVLGEERAMRIAAEAQIRELQAELGRLRGDRLDSQG